MPRVQRDSGAPVKVLVEADGGSRGNPGLAGYGAVVFSPDHQTVLGRPVMPSAMRPTMSPSTGA